MTGQTNPGGATRINREEQSMDLNEAQDIVLRKVENPTASIPDETLLTALATVIVRTGLLTARAETVTLGLFASGPAGVTDV